MPAAASHVDQVLSGVRRVLSNPFAYDALQTILGVPSARKLVCDSFVAAKDGDVVLDVGCGTAELLQYLPLGCNYFGFDLSQAYLDAASARYEGRQNCRFICADLGSVTGQDLPPCDHAVAYGVLHHLSDAAASGVFNGVLDRLVPGGSMVTVDPVFVDGQNFIARELIRRDRGQHVRTAEGYMALVPNQFGAKSVSVRHDLLRVPYSLAIMVCQKAPV